jgi:hypothetical protein
MITPKYTCTLIFIAALFKISLKSGINPYALQWVEQVKKMAKGNSYICVYKNIIYS